MSFLSKIRNKAKKLAKPPTSVKDLKDPAGLTSKDKGGSTRPLLSSAGREPVDQGETLLPRPMRSTKPDLESREVVAPMYAKPAMLVEQGRFKTVVRDRGEPRVRRERLV